MVLQGFFSKDDFYVDPKTLKEPFACFSGSLHGKTVLQVDEECVEYLGLYSTKKGSATVMMLSLSQ